MSMESDVCEVVRRLHAAEGLSRMNCVLLLRELYGALEWEVEGVCCHHNDWEEQEKVAVFRLLWPEEGT